MVIFRHALKNGLIPIITLAGMGIPMIVGGTVVIETVFNIPGMGRLAVASVQNQDYPYVQGIILIISTTVLMANRLVDIITAGLISESVLIKEGKMANEVAMSGISEAPPRVSEWRRFRRVFFSREL